MHALYIACIHQIYLKEYGKQCSSKERRGNLSAVSVALFLAVSSLRRQRDLVYCVSELCSARGLWNWPCSFFSIGINMKGIYKAGFKYISNIFVVKERELEIGHPTDAKHVAHIGWDGSSGSAPSWMKEFKKGPDFAASTIENNGSSLSPWSSQDFGESKAADLCNKDITSPELPNIPKSKQKRKKSRSPSYPKSGSSSSSLRSSKAANPKSKFVEASTKTLKIEPKPINIEVA